MRIFRTLLPILLFSVLSGQINTILVEDDSLYIVNIETIEDTLTKILYDEDRFGDSFKLKSIGSLLKYSRIRNNIFIDTVYVTNSTLRPKVFMRMFESIIGTKPVIETTEQFYRIINGYLAFTDSSSIRYGLTIQQKVGAVINLNANYNNYFSGIFGASNENNAWTINGQIDIHLENQWRTGNILDLHWKRIDEDSQVLRLFIEEPHPFNLPIGINAKYNQDLRDGNYLSSESSVGIIKTVPSIAKIGFGGISKEINATDQGDSLGIESLNSKSVYLNSIIDHRNDYWIPDQGYYVNIDATVGSGHINNVDYNNLQVLVNAQKYFRVTSITSVLTKLYGQGVWVDVGKVHIGEQPRYGGINTLRGYTEDIFKSNWVLIPTIEISAKMSGKQKIDLFYDFAIQDKYTENPFGYGIGFTQVSDNSVLRLFYALNKNDKIKNGKIHIQFLTLL